MSRVERVNALLRQVEDETQMAFDEHAKLLQENAKLRHENERLRTLVCHLYYVKPRDVASILVNGKVLDFDELMAEVGLRWEDK